MLCTLLLPVENLHTRKKKHHFSWHLLFSASHKPRVSPLPLFYAVLVQKCILVCVCCCVFIVVLRLLRYIAARGCGLRRSLLRCCCVVAAWLLRGCCVVAAWLLRGCCVVAAWLLRGYCVVVALL
jgi:hypothetical protein